MLLSIITISKDNLDSLKKTIQSVLGQTNRNFEYIVIDGSVSSETRIYLEQISSDLSYWVSEPDNGIYAAMNKGIQKSNGTYLLFLNSGDVFADNAIVESVYDTLIHSFADILYGDLCLVSLDGQKQVTTYPDELSLEYLFSNSIAHPSTFIKKETFFTIGFYDESYKIVADWLHILRCFNSPSICFKHLDKVISQFSLGGISSQMSQQNLLKAERARGIQETFSSDLLRIINEHAYLKRDNNRFAIPYLKTFGKKIKTVLGTITKPFTVLFDELAVISHDLQFKIHYKKFLECNSARSKKIPIIINNRNRLTSLHELIHSLEKRGYYNIIILDNDSSYPPLLAFYAQTPYRVIYLKKNVGFCAIWDAGIYAEFQGDFYVYTDSDVALNENCPDDVLCRLLYMIENIAGIEKVGLGLKIDDLPDHYALKADVVKWETDLILQSRKILTDVFLASVDTTFALYAPGKFGPAGYLKSIRVYGKYQIKHFPWYIDTHHLNEEEIFYLEHAHTISYTYWTAAVKNKYLNKA